MKWIKTFANGHRFWDKKHEKTFSHVNSAFLTLRKCYKLAMICIRTSKPWNFGESRVIENCQKLFLKEENIHIVVVNT